MGKRNLAYIEEKPYFESAEQDVEDLNGFRNLRPSLPFVISGGSNTEFLYFKHISNHTAFKFEVSPEYFGDESRYTQVFLRYIERILSGNPDAVIFCVFDWDTIYANKTKLRKHKEFILNVRTLDVNNNVHICPTMPCFEYWLLLHFTNYTGFLKNYSKVANKLAPYKNHFLGSKGKMKDLLKKKEYLQNPDWVISLCKDDKLSNAIRIAEENITIALSNNDLQNQSYSYIYKLFHTICSKNNVDSE